MQVHVHTRASRTSMCAKMDARPSRKLKLLQQIGMIPSRQPRMTPSRPGMTQAKMARQYGIRTQTNGCIIARENTSKLGTANSGKMQRQGHRGGWEIDWGQSDMGNGVARRSREPAAALTAWLLVISSTETSSAFDNLSITYVFRCKWQPNTKIDKFRKKSDKSKKLWN